MTNPEINEAVARKLGFNPRASVFDKDGYTVIADEEPIPDYCASIAAAWEIVERMNSNCNVVSVVCQKNTFYVRFIDMGAVWNGELSTTAPMAICLAYLKLDSEI